jgi:dihydroxyacetone kinase-like predicted kinase
VAVAQSATAAQLLESLGATSVLIPAKVSPTVNELLNSVQRLGHEQILLLPSDKNTTLATEQLKGLTSRRIHVVPTENVVQTMQCLLALNPDRSLDDQASRLAAATQNATVIELARANRAAQLPGATVSVGSIVAIRDGEVVVAGESAAKVAYEAVEGLGRADFDLVTLHPCADIDTLELQQLEEKLRALLPEAEHDTVRLDLPARLAVIALE